MCNIIFIIYYFCKFNTLCTRVKEAALVSYLMSIAAHPEFGKLNKSHWLTEY